MKKYRIEFDNEKGECYHIDATLKGNKLEEVFVKNYSNNIEKKIKIKNISVWEREKDGGFICKKIIKENYQTKE